MYFSNMDCITGIDPDRSRLGARPVSAAFHLAVIEQAIAFISLNLPHSLRGPEGCELQAACDDATEALAELNVALKRAPAPNITA